MKGARKTKERSLPVPEVAEALWKEQCRDKTNDQQEKEARQLLPAGTDHFTKLAKSTPLKNSSLNPEIPPQGAELNQSSPEPPYLPQTVPDATSARPRREVELP